MFLLENNLQPGRTITGPHQCHLMTPHRPAPITQAWQSFHWGWGAGWKTLMMGSALDGFQLFY